MSEMTRKKIISLIVLLVVWILIYINLQTFAYFAVEKIFHLESGKHLTESILFFIFEVSKVLLLLVLIIFLSARAQSQKIFRTLILIRNAS